MEKSVEKSWPSGWVSVKEYVASIEDESEEDFCAGIEAELCREMPASHVLASTRYRLIGVCEDYYDDFLFEVSEAEFRFAAVHLTWSEERDPTWPATSVYHSWEDFLKACSR